MSPEYPQSTDSRVLAADRLPEQPIQDGLPSNGLIGQSIINIWFFALEEIEHVKVLTLLFSGRGFFAIR